MTPERFRDCLARLHWSQRGLAEVLYCDERLVRRWAEGSEAVPASIARWLDNLAYAHETAVQPTAEDLIQVRNYKNEAEER